MNAFINLVVFGFVIIADERGSGEALGKFRLKFSCTLSLYGSEFVYLWLDQTGFSGVITSQI